MPAFAFTSNVKTGFTSMSTSDYVHFYRPQRSCGQGYVFTRVRDSVNRGLSASVHAGIPPHPPGGRPPHPEADTPQKADIPLGSRHHPPWEADPPPGKQTPPPEADPPGSRLQHTVNERPVRILLECILVNVCIFKNETAETKEIRKCRRYVWMDLKNYTINTQNREKRLFPF